MTVRQSAGVLLYRWRSGAPQVLLVHPGGPFWQRRDAGAWSLPKGEFDPGESAEAAARREFREETGHAAPIHLRPLRTVRQAGGKVIHAFAGEGDLDVATLQSDTFEMEWPPKSGTTRAFPEVDRAEWFDPPAAWQKLNAGQRPILTELIEMLGPDVDR